MEELPVELLIYIFNYVPSNLIAISQVCRYFRVITTTQIRKMSIKFQKESEQEILKIAKELKSFESLKCLKVGLSQDVNISEKADFCTKYSNTITYLILNDFSFLNPFFDKPHIIYSNLEVLVIENCDLTSSTDDLPDFILKTCIKLRHLRMTGCSGLEIESLNKIGRELHNTKIEKLELHPTYSYFDMSSQNRDQSWTIENLKTLSIRSKLVVMKKNFVRNMLGNNRIFPNMNKLELIAEVNFGNLELTNQFPNLVELAIGKGVVDIHNRDFVTICNAYKSLTSLEFHFIHQDEKVDLRYLQKNDSIKHMTIGLTKEVTFDHLGKISKSLPNLSKLYVILYYLIPSHQEYLEKLVKIFPSIKKLSFSHIGMTDKIQLLL